MTTKPVLVMLHGHGVDASIWDSIYADLSATCTVFRPDFSQLTELTSIDAYASVLHTYMQTQGLDQAIIAGHSMGGYIALAFAEHYPDQVSALVLVHSTAFADDDARRQKRAAAIDRLAQTGSQGFISDAITAMFAPDNRIKLATIRQQLITHNSNLPANALIAGLKAMRDRPDRTSVLRDAPWPVMLLLGKQDELINYNTTKPLAELPAIGQLVTLEQSGHLGIIEQPEQTIEALRQMASRVAQKA